MDTLPPALLTRILSVLPVISRACAACVCRGWRDALADPTLWDVLEFSQVAANKVKPALIKGVADRAAGQLRVLDFSAVHENKMYNLNELWREIIETNSAALRTVRFGWMEVDDLAWVASTTPQLDVLEAEVHGSGAVLASALRNEVPFGKLQATRVSVSCENVESAELREVAFALAKHRSVCELTLVDYVYDTGVADALLDACAEHVTALKLRVCDHFIHNTAALARLLQNGSLKVLNVGFDDNTIKNMPLLAQLREAFQASELTHLTLQGKVSGQRGDIGHVLDAAAAISTLQFLKVYIQRRGEYDDTRRDDAALGSAFGVFLARDMPSLHTLDVGDYNLGSEALLHLLAGLSGNTHLHKLELHYLSRQYRDEDHGVPVKDFTHDFLEPALKVLAARADERSAQPA